MRMGVRSQGMGFFSELSLGTKQKLSIAFALASQRAIVLIDEPTIGLDRDAKKVLESIYLMCYSGKRAAKAINLLRSRGCRKLVYITFGYGKYANSQEDFVPKVGRCDCLAD